MPTEAPHRITVTEYGDAHTAIADAAAALGVPRSEILALIEASNVRLARLLRSRSGPLQVLGDGLRVEDVAGLVRLSPRLELEVAPKFLGNGWKKWREDFFLIATLSRYGTLLAGDRLSAGFGEKNDLATLVGRALVDEYWRHHRRPLRIYQRSVIRDFSLDGDAAPEEFVMVDPDGYAQEIVRFTSANEFNAVVHAAASQLLTEVRDAETRQQLRRVRDALAPQNQASRLNRASVPSRHRRWQTLYDLSRQVLGGFGMSLAQAGHLFAPGYIMRTPKSWEDVVVAGLWTGLPGARVRVQHGWVLGERNGTPFKATPDATVDLGEKRILVDAKYKTRLGRDRGRITAEDVYEGLSFMRAAECNELALLYPAPIVQSVPDSVGTTSRFEKVTVDGMTIHGFHAEVRDLASRGGFRRFSCELGAMVQRLLD